MHTVYLQQPDGAMAEGAQTENLSCSPVTVQKVAYRDRALLKQTEMWRESNVLLLNDVTPKVDKTFHIINLIDW